MNSKINNYIFKIYLLLIVQLIIITIAIWSIDISVTAIMNGLILSNGIYLIEPKLMYHIGLYTVLLSSFIFNIVIFNNVLNRTRQCKNNYQT